MVEIPKLNFDMMKPLGPFAFGNGGSGLSRVFRVLLKSPPISSVMNNILSHHYATLIAQNSKLQFEFVFPHFAIYNSWQLKD